MTYLIDRQTDFSKSSATLLVGLVSSLCLLLGVWGAPTAHAAFGLLPGAAGFDGSTLNRDGSLDTQAGSHPYSLTTGLYFNTTFNSVGKLAADGSAKDIQVNLPAGFVGNPNATTKCSPAQLARENGGTAAENCPLSSQVGVALVRFTLSQGNINYAVPAFNITAPAGTPGVVGFVINGVEVFINSKVRTGSDYGVSTVSPDIASGLPLTGVKLTLWGIPADASHDTQRCLEINQETGYCYGPGSASDIPVKPFLTLPSACDGPQAMTIAADSWQEPGIFVEDSFLTHDSEGNPVGYDGCNRLGFAPTIAVQPETSAADTPTGLRVDVRVPQDEDPDGVATADLKNAVVTLPAGVAVNPSAADGLQSCGLTQIALSSPAPATCPEASRVGSVEVDSPLVDHALLGGVYLAAQGANPFGSLIAVYIAIADPQTGTVIKVAGRVELDSQTGQLTTVFDNNPQLPFEDLKLDFFNGPRAALVTPQSCGTYATTSDLTPWSTPYENDATPADSFAVESGASGAGCGTGFAPGFSAGTLNGQADAFSSFSTSFSRSDADQELSGLTLTTPPGLLGILKGVERCPEPQASQGTCGQGSMIGRTSATAGAGSDPVSVTGRVFLTGPYKSAPFGLSIVVPAAVGPFDLGTVVVRAAVGVDPHTAQITVKSDPFPTILQGVPLKLRKVNVTIDRPGFIFNATNCEPFTVDGLLTSTQGATANVSSHYQAVNCASLPFKPKFTVSTQANTSKKQGASLDVKLGYPQGTQANIRSVAVMLPKQLPSRLTTIQQACPQATFNANPASCPVGSNIGTATATTPVLTSPVSGPAYLVSHGGAAFPDLVLILQGEGIALQLTGSIDIKHNITSSTFASVPDAPIDTFELKLPEGSHSGLAAVLPAKAKGSLCGTSLVMPTTLTGQNGAQIKQSTKIAVTGCAKPKAKKKPKAKHTKAKKK